MNEILSDQEREFAAAYVAKGGNATKAAIAAGYSQHTAKQAGSRLTQRPRVQAEIVRIGGFSEDSTAFGMTNADSIGVGKDSQGRAGPEHRGAAHLPVEADRDLASRLSRDWMVARLMRTVMMCCGELERTFVKLVVRTDGKSKTVITTAQIKARAHDIAGAVAALGQLAKITGLSMPLAAPLDEHDVSRIPGRVEQQQTLDAFDIMAEHYRAQGEAREAAKQRESGKRDDQLAS